MGIIKNKKVVYFGDMMLTGDVDSIDEEFEKTIQPELLRNDLIFQNVTCVDYPPFGENYDILFFDWGGMSMGNDILGSFCREITQEAKNRPNTYYVMTSTFTKYAMEDAIDRLDDKPFNIFLSISQFVEFYKTYEIIK
jgi:hypothetical protein